MTNPTPWDEPAIELLTQLRAAGYSSGAIANELNTKGYNFTRNAIIGKMHRLDLPSPPDDVAHKKLKRERQVTAGKMRAGPAKVKFIFHRKPQSLGAHAVMEALPMEASNPTGSNAILLTDSRDGQCRAIIGYENGELGKAIICGDPTPIRIRRGMEIRISWCAHHHELYTQEDRPHR